LNDKRQKKIFFEAIGREDERSFHEERLLEKDIAKLILKRPPSQRDASYQEGYERLHKFLSSLINGKGIYYGANLQKVLRRQNLLSRIVGKNQRVLEVGCGEGLLSIALSRLGNLVTSTDVSNTCISMAKRNKARFAAENVNFFVMNASKLDFPQETFDWVVSADLLEHLHPQDAQSHLREAARILKPRGKYLLVTPNASAGMHAGKVHLKEYNYEELRKLFFHAGFYVKSPMISYISPLNVLVTIEVKLLFQKLFHNKKFLNEIMCLDPIVLVAVKHG